VAADDEDEILVAALGQVGGVSHAPGARRGGRGARSAARRLAKDVHEIELPVAAPLGEAYAQVASLLGSIGQIVARSDHTGGTAIVRGVVGSGAMGLNPAVITVTMTAAGEGSTTVHIRGAAKEGFIKQRAGEKAARRFAALLGRPELPR
jgi:hypothetical protein